MLTESLIGSLVALSIVALCLVQCGEPPVGSLVGSPLGSLVGSPLCSLVDSPVAQG